MWFSVFFIPFQLALIDRSINGFAIFFLINWYWFFFRPLNMENSGNGASMIARNARKWKENGNRVERDSNLSPLGLKVELVNHCSTYYANTFQFNSSISVSFIFVTRLAHCWQQTWTDVSNLVNVENGRRASTFSILQSLRTADVNRRFSFRFIWHIFEKCTESGLQFTFHGLPSTVC